MKRGLNGQIVLEHRARSSSSTGLCGSGKGAAGEQILYGFGEEPGLLGQNRKWVLLVG